MARRRVPLRAANALRLAAAAAAVTVAAGSPLGTPAGALNSPALVLLDDDIQAASAGGIGDVGGATPPADTATGHPGDDAASRQRSSRSSPPLGVETARLYGNINQYAYYFIDILVGSPNPQVASVIVDTGSRLVGFPCRGCDHCGRNHLDRPFDINASRSARWITCSECFTGMCAGDQCLYSETYSEGSSIAGRWFDDVVELGGTFKKNPPVRARMGCHENENKLFYTQRANGIMGLAPWGEGFNASDPTILQDFFQDKKHVDTQIFSLCLATWGGEFTVGGYDASYHAPGAVLQWTPMSASHYYFVFPEGMTVSMPSAAGAETTVVTGNDGFGVTIVDSGTTFAYFAPSVYIPLIATLDRLCAPELGSCGATPRENDCYRPWDPRMGPVRFPTLTILFRNSAKVEWAPKDYLHERGQPGVYCLTFMQNNLQQTVLGISWMLHKNLIFDIKNKRLGIVKANCPEHRKVEEAGTIQRNEIVAERKGDLVGPLLPMLPQLRRPGSAPHSPAEAATAAVAAARSPPLLALLAVGMPTVALLGWTLMAVRHRKRCRMVARVDQDDPDCEDVHTALVPEAPGRA